METSITNIKRDPLPNSRGGLKFSVVRSKAVLLATIGFVFSYILSPYYYAGDQAFYRAFYFGVQNYNSWEEKYSYYKSILDAAEPAYLIIVNLVSPYIEKDLFFSVVNGLLYGVVCLFFLKKKRGLIFCLLMLVNYYLVVLDFSAERLKLGVFFVVLALLFDGYKRYVLILIACLCQFQLIIVAAAVFLPNAVKYKSHLSKKNIFSVILFAVVLMVVVSRLDYGMVFDHLRGKSEVYSDQGWGGYMAVVKPGRSQI